MERALWILNVWRELERRLCQVWKQVTVQRDWQRGSEKARAKLKCNKAAGKDGTAKKIIKYGRGVEVQLMFWIRDCMETRKSTWWVEGGNNCASAQGKDSKNKCNNYRGMKLLTMPWKVYGRVLIKKLMEVTQRKDGEE